jgi:hypothetical protein
MKLEENQEFPTTYACCSTSNPEHTPLLSYSALLMPKIIPGAVHITKFVEGVCNPNYQFSSFVPFCFVYDQPALW